jgi:hypothetical protein
MNEHKEQGKLSLETIILENGDKANALKLKDGRAIVFNKEYMTEETIHVEVYIPSSKKSNRYAINSAYHRCISILPRELQEHLGKPIPSYGNCTKSKAGVESCRNCSFGEL